MNKRTRKWYGEQTAQKPTKVSGQTATRTAFYRRELYKICKSLFEIECPEEWDKDYILENLLRRGYIIISTTPAGCLPIYGSLTGFNYINFPTMAVIASPILGNWENTLDVDAVLIYLEHDYNRWFYKLSDIVQITAEKLASADAAIDVNVFNSRLAYVAEAESKAQSETIKDLYDRVAEGNPLVVYRKDALTDAKNGMQLFFNNIKQNFIAAELQDAKRTIMNEFLTALGINNANTDKKERLITNEVAANNIELDANISHWSENLEKQTKKVNRIFPNVSFSIKLRYEEINKKAIEMSFMNVTTKTEAQSNQEGGASNDPTERN